MIRFHEIKTNPIDAKSFKDKALAQGWEKQIVYDLMLKLIDYDQYAPFVIDNNGKVYISNHYRFDLLHFELNEDFFDWYPLIDNTTEIMH